MESDKSQNPNIPPLRELHMSRFLQVLADLFSRNCDANPVIRPVEQPVLTNEHEPFEFAAEQQIQGYEQLLQVACPTFSKSQKLVEKTDNLSVFFWPEIEFELLLREQDKHYITPSLIYNAEFEYQIIPERCPMIISQTRDPQLARLLTLAYQLRERKYQREILEGLNNVTEFDLSRYSLPRMLSISEKQQLNQDLRTFADYVIKIAEGEYPERLNPKYNHTTTQLYLLENCLIPLVGDVVYKIELKLEDISFNAAFKAVPELTLANFERYYLPGIILSHAQRFILTHPQLLYFTEEMVEIFDDFSILPRGFIVRELRPDMLTYRFNRVAFCYPMNFRRSPELSVLDRFTAYKLQKTDLDNGLMRYSTGLTTKDFPDITGYFERKTEHLVDFQYPFPDFLQYRKTPFATRDLGDLLQEFDYYITHNHLDGESDPKNVDANSNVDMIDGSHKATPSNVL